jgi:hypothetical protein
MQMLTIVGNGELKLEADHERACELLGGGGFAKVGRRGGFSSQADSVAKEEG